MEIPLTQGKRAQIDDVDAQFAQFRWRAMWNGAAWYAVRWTKSVDGKRRQVYLHREILGVTDGRTIVDHADRDGLNCRRANLRVATSSQNNANQGRRRDNRSGFRGVYWDKERSLWATYIRVNKQKRHIGRFDSAEEAARAYDAAAREAFGSFACVNFPEA